MRYASLTHPTRSAIAYIEPVLVMRYASLTHPTRSAIALNGGQWREMESYLQNKLADQEKKELYIISGGYGFNTEHTKGDDETVTGIKIPDHVWKVVAVLEAGQGISDITAATPLIVVDIPNDDSAVSRAWYDINNGYRITLGELEDRINRNEGDINFFSNLPTEIRNALKQKGIDPLPVPPGSANLLADLEAPVLSIYQSVFQSQNFSIGQFGILESTLSQPSVTNNSLAQIYIHETGLINNSGFPTNIFENGISQISTPKVSLNKNTSLKDSVPQVGTTEIAAIKPASAKSNVLNHSTAQVGIVEGGGVDLGTTQIGIAQVGITEVRQNKNTVTQISITKIGFNEQNFLQLNSTQINASQIQPGEIQPPTSRVIQIQQFLTGHNFNLQNTNVPAWTSFLQGQTPFNLNIEIKDLPTGQLAEASLTGFDSIDRPTSGTLTLDLDGNGLGWFIDSTPWDNSVLRTGNDLDRTRKMCLAIAITHQFMNTALQE
jgi:DNA/RNA non-specific endonuclease